MRRNFLIFVCAFLCLLFTSEARETSSNADDLQHETTVTLKLVQVHVLDKEGNPVRGLKNADFEIFDNGIAKQITEFEEHYITSTKSKGTILPGRSSAESPSLQRLNRKFFLFFDFAFNDSSGVIRSRKAALHFIESDLQPDDEIAMLSYSTIKGMVVHEFLTANHGRIRRLIADVGIKDALGRAETLKNLYQPEVREGEQETLYATEANDSSIQIYSNQVAGFCKQMIDLAKAFRYIPGRKFIIFFSGGIANFILYGKSAVWGIDIVHREQTGDLQLNEMYTKTCQELAASNCLVYAINTTRLTDALSKGRHMAGDYSLKDLSSVSGGKYFDDINQYESIFKEIQNLLSHYYVLGYYVDERWDGKYHEVEVKIKRKGCSVQAQRGFFNPRPFPEFTLFEKQLHLIDLALSEKPQFQEPVQIPMKAFALPGMRESNILLLAEIDRNEVLRKIDGQKLEVVSFIVNSDNHIQTFIQDNLCDNGDGQTNGFVYALLSARPGAYETRLIIRNLVSGRAAVGYSAIQVIDPPYRSLMISSPLLFKPAEGTNFWQVGTGQIERNHKKESFSKIFPFDINGYIPIVGKIEEGTSPILAVLRCTHRGIQNPTIHYSILISPYSKIQKIPLDLRVLSEHRVKDALWSLIEIALPGLSRGEYLLDFVAEEASSRTRSSATYSLRVQ